MKKLLFLMEILLIVVVFVGCVLGVVGSAMLALDNAMYDYYNHTSRQLAGWMLCFVPVVLAAGAVAAYLLRRKIKVLELVGTAVLFLAAFIPFIYMSVYGTFLIFNFVSVVLWFIAGVGALKISYFSRSTKEQI